tara:strand:+ start:1145 stop:1786 length:642 start_codon:yes stop_codon:yes gene_type:complete
MRTLILTALGAAALSTGLASAQDVRELELTGFDSIRAGGGYQLVVTVGDSWSVSLDGDADDFGEIEARVDDGQLVLSQHQRMFRGRRGLDVTVRVSLPEIEAMDFHRGIEGEVTGIAADALSVDVNTGAEVELSGTCGTLDVDLSTGASLQARRLECRDVDVDASTGAEGRVFASERAEVHASMGASVRVFGSPSDREAQSSMGGEVRFDAGD